MNNHRYFSLLLASYIICVVLAACSLATATPVLTETVPSSTGENLTPTITMSSIPTALPLTETATSLPATSTPIVFPLRMPEPGTVVLDFVALACRAHWVNGAFDLPCPGDLNNLAEGFIAPANQALAEGRVVIEAPVLIGLPGSGGQHGAGLFGIYPALLVQSGDTFYSAVACQEGSACDVEFALEYFDAQGNYQHAMGWSWKHAYGGGLVPVQVDLSPLAGQTAQLALVVRDQGTPEDDWVLWIYPYIARSVP